MLAIEQILLDQFNDNSIIELELANKQGDDDNNSIIEYETDSANGTILQWQLVSDNDPFSARFAKAKEVVETSLRFRSNP